MGVQIPWSNPKIVDTTHEGFPVQGLWSNPAYFATQRPTTVWNMIDDGGDFVPMAIVPIT
jgi:hypothetical protein